MRNLLARFSLATLIAAVLSVAAFAQRVAILTPEGNAQALEIAERFEAPFADKFKLIDRSMAASAFRSSTPESPFNMTADQAKNVANAVGCDAFVLLKTETLRRSSFDRPEYYESYLAIYGVNGRSGQLVEWQLSTFKENDPAAASKRLAEAAPEIARIFAANLVTSGTHRTERPPMETINVDQTDKDLKQPTPYRRIKPVYTATAYLYGIRGTVDIEADIDDTGKILRTAIVRWAGFGLDDAVDEAVRAMNWRPAMRGGKALPMRVLLRYNFSKIEKE
ncbi:MAG: energy transducer TonB [Pyrinomonadaceae bacterium]